MVELSYFINEPSCRSHGRSGRLTWPGLDIEAVLRANPADLDARVSRTIIAAENQQFQKAGDELKHVLQLDPDDFRCFQTR